MTHRPPYRSSPSVALAVYLIATSLLPLLSTADPFLIRAFGAPCRPDVVRVVSGDPVCKATTAMRRCYCMHGRLPPIRTAALVGSSHRRPATTTTVASLTGRVWTQRPDRSVRGRDGRHGLLSSSILPVLRGTGGSERNGGLITHRRPTRRHFAAAASTATDDAVAINDSTTKISTNSELEATYSELKTLSSEIRRHDTLYYSEQGGPQISDDEYDALARREADLCASHPELLKRLEEESGGLGSKVTRWGGRVGYVSNESDGGNGEDGVVEEGAGGGDATTAAPGTTVASGRSVKLVHLESTPMMSLDNAMSEDDVVRWLNRLRKLLVPPPSSPSASSIGGSGGHDAPSQVEDALENVTVEVLAEPKMDGLSLSLRYELVGGPVDGEEPSGGKSNGEKGWAYEFKWGATRGDGTRGEDVTESVRAMMMDENNAPGRSSSVPAEFVLERGVEEGGIPPPSIVEARGEVVLPRSTFRRLRDTYDAAMVASASEEDHAEGMDAETKNADHPSGANVDNNEGGSAPPLLPNRFANARNAASGILLRSKEETDEEAANTRLLRSCLWFYAYDVAVLPDAPDGMFGSSGVEMRQSLVVGLFYCSRTGCRFVRPLDADTEVASDKVQDLFQYHGRMMSSRDLDLSDDQRPRPQQLG